MILLKIKPVFQQEVTMTTLRREAIKIAEDILIPAYSDSPQTEDAMNYAKEQAIKVVDALLELRGFSFVKTPLSIENAIAMNLPVTEEMAEQASTQNNAPRQFERALGFSKPLPWWSNKDWTAFAEWVCERYAEDKLCFGNYNIWRHTPYTKGGMSNPRIRGFVAEFYDSWDMFKMATGHKTDEMRPEYKPFVDTREGDEYLTENPFKDKRK
jgi:hypothetical protein